VEIRNDAATRRRISEGNMYVDGGAWTLGGDETGSQIGQYTGDSRGGPAATMEQLFGEGGAVLARNPAADYPRPELDPARGIPIRCTYFPRGCADDCEVGIRITSFACAPLLDAGSF